MMDSIKHGVGAYAWLRTGEGISGFLPLPAEDQGKSERVVGSGLYIPLSTAMLGIVSGGVEKGEPHDFAVRRELLEERQVYSVDSKIVNSLPQLTVGQFRDGKYVSFDVTGHVMYIDPSLRADLLGKTPIIEVSDGGLDQFLTERGQDLRPFVYSVAMTLLQSGKIYRL